VNVELEVGEPTSLAMLELMTRLRMPFATCEPIECLSKVLDGTFVACGSRTSRIFDVVSRYLLILQLCPWCLTLNLENKIMVYSQAFAPFHAFEVGTP